MRTNRCRSPPPRANSFPSASSPLNPRADSAPIPASVDAEPPTAIRISCTRESSSAALIACPSPKECAPSGSSCSTVVIPHNVAISIMAVLPSTSNHDDWSSIPVAPCTVIGMRSEFGETLSIQSSVPSPPSANGAITISSSG